MAKDLAQLLSNDQWMSYAKVTSLLSLATGKVCGIMIGGKGI